MQFPSSIPTPPSSPAVTSAPLHVLSCLCRKAQAHACATGARGALWASWPLLACLASMEPAASGLHREGSSGRPEKKSLTFPPFYQIRLELSNELGVSLLTERSFWDSMWVSSLSLLKSREAWGEIHTLCTTLIKCQAFGSWNWDVCLYNISEQKFRH